LYSKRRDTKINNFRHIICLILYEKTYESVSAIGRKLRRDHTTILHSIKQARRLLKTDKEMLNFYKECLS
jgi:chromosomal replication initiation ATPase DnaA